MKLHNAARAGLLPTPQAQDAKHGQATEWELGRRGQKDLLHVTLTQQLLPTPRAGKNTSEDEETWLARQAEGKVATPPLALAVRMALLPTPAARDWKSSNASEETMARNARPLNETVSQGKGGSLNPTFVAWMMGWPLRWLDLPAPTGGPRGRRVRASRPSPPESPSAPTSSAPSAMAGCLTWRATLLDAFRRGWIAAMSEHDNNAPEAQLTMEELTCTGS
jgi:hypothetical protein